MVNFIQRLLPNGQTPGGNNIKSIQNVPSLDELERSIRSQRNGMQIINPQAFKTDLFSRSAIDFINANNNVETLRYDENVLLNAYMTSVYMFAALRRVANLISKVKIVAEVKKDDNFVRLPETAMINRIFEQDGGRVLSRMWLNYAVYGSTVVYKTKTRRAAIALNENQPIFDYKDGAVAGLHVIDKPAWDLDEDPIDGLIKGLYISNTSDDRSVVGDRNYLDRKEFVYASDWNPIDPNRGTSLVSVAIHEAVANASIAQWMAEYFTRGAMPFIMVSMEDDPALITDNDLRKYRRQFEEYWQGIGSSLRSVFFDRNVKVEQVGINASDIAAPDLNEAALEGISATIGLDRKLIVTTDGGSYAEHVQLIKRAWEDTVIPLAELFRDAFQRDLGLPENARLTLDLSEISELDIDRDERSGTEISIYESGLQFYNEARTRLKMPPIDELDGWIQIGDRLIPVDRIHEAKDVPFQALKEYAFELWNENLATKSQVLGILGRELPPGDRDGYKSDLEGKDDLVQGLWGDDLLTRSQTLSVIGYDMPTDVPDGYKSELERGADYGDFITGLWSDNLLTRSQAIELLDMNIELPERSPDGYADEIGDRKSTVMDMWGDNLMTRGEAMERLGSKIPSNMIDGFIGEVEGRVDKELEAAQNRIDNLMDFYGENLLTKSQMVGLLGITPPEGMIDGYVSEIEAEEEFRSKMNKKDLALELWGENLLTKQQVLDSLGVTGPSDMVDGYMMEVEPLVEFHVEQEIEALTPKDEEGGNDSGSGWRSIMKYVDDGNDNPPENDGPDNPDDPNELDNPDGYTIQSNGLYAVEEPIEISGEQYYQNRPIYPQEIIEEEVVETKYTDDRLVWKKLTKDILGEIKNDADAPPVDAAEEDFYEDYGHEDSDIMYPSYGDSVDILPPEVLPTYDDYIEPWIEQKSNMEPDHDMIAALGHVSKKRLTEMEDEIIKGIYGENHDELIVDFDETIVETEIEDYENDPSPLEVDTENEMWTSIWFGENADLKNLQNRIKYGLTRLQEPDKFHITLMYSSSIDDTVAGNIINIMPDKFTEFEVNLDWVDIFDTDDGYAIVLRTSNEDKLEPIHRKMNLAFGSQGAAISPYSELGSWKPHVTLGYTTENMVDKIKKELEVLLPLTVTPEFISIGRGDYDLFATIPIKSVTDVLDGHNEPDGTQNKYYSAKALADEQAQLDMMIRQAKRRRKIKDAQRKGLSYQDDINSEMKAWQKATVKSGLKKGLNFETHWIDPKVEQSIKSDLNKLDKHDTDAIKSIFNKWKEE